MDSIRQAIERAKESGVAYASPPEQASAALQQSQFRDGAGSPGAVKSLAEKFALNGAYLESKRIVTHDTMDPRSRAFDMLRTQVLQSMNMKGWQLLGITSPTAGCGKTVTSINLALSIARQPEQKVLLVDMDLQKAQVDNILGFKCKQSLVGVLEGKTNLSSALVQVHIKNQQLLVLPSETATAGSSEWMASRAMRSLLEEIKRDFKGWTVILDLPPMLTGDHVISILPEIDCILFVAAVGTSTIAEIKECNKHLESSPVVRVVVNKAPDKTHSYYY